jgi:hypothetical protein
LSASPNPAPDGRTRVLYRLPIEGAEFELALFDASGRLVRRLAAGAASPDVAATEWDGRDSAGRAVAPGVYFLRLFSAAGVSVSERITVVR